MTRPAATGRRRERRRWAACSSSARRSWPRSRRRRWGARGPPNWPWGLGSSCSSPRSAASTTRSASRAGATSGCARARSWRCRCRRRCCSACTWRGRPSSAGLWGTPARVDLGWLYPVLCMILVVGMANAVNLTDGLDGLAAGSVAIAAAALAVLTGRACAVSVGVIAAAVSGAALGFLWFNAHPARVFMGDVGSQGLGAALAVTGVLGKLEIAMLIVGGLFVVEALSVIAQVAYFRLTGGRRLLRMSPLHHHYELGGWTETQTVVRFWLCGAVLAVLGVGLTS